MPEWLQWLASDNPAAYVNMLELQNGTYNVSYMYPQNTGGPYTGKITSNYVFSVGDVFMWTFGLAQVTKVSKNKGV